VKGGKPRTLSEKVLFKVDDLLFGKKKMQTKAVKTKKVKSRRKYPEDLDHRLRKDERAPEHLKGRSKHRKNTKDHRPGVTKGK